MFPAKMKAPRPSKFPPTANFPCKDRKHRTVFTSLQVLCAFECFADTNNVGQIFIIRKIQNNGNSENKHFEFILAFDYILVIIRNDASYIHNSDTYIIT